MDGRIISEEGNTREVLSNPSHERTRSLLSGVH